MQRDKIAATQLDVATGSFNAAFAVAGVLALVGAAVALAPVHGTLGEPVRPSPVTSRLAS